MVRRIIPPWEANYNRNRVTQLQAVRNTAEPISSTEEDDYVSRIVKLIPAEIIAAFVATEAVLSSVTDIPNYDVFIIKLIIFIVLQIMTIFYLLRVVHSPAIRDDRTSEKKIRDARRLQI